MLRHVTASCVTLVALCQVAVAQIAISRCPTPTPDTARGLGAQAVCVLEPTDNAEALASSIEGYFLFVKVAGPSNDGTDDIICVEYNIENIAEGDHGFHVHTYGSLLSTDGSATDNHFQGDCDECRPDAVNVNLTSEVGLLNDGAPLVVDATNTVEGFFNDEIIQFTGVNSIIGRSVVVHAVDGSRLGQCVIGHNNDPVLTASQINNVDGVTRAVARLTSSNQTSGSGEEAGFIRFTQRSPSDDLLVELWVTGLQSCDEIHPFHVHQRADISGDPMFTGDHFVGNIATTGTRNEIGQLGPNDDVNPGIAARRRSTDEQYCSGTWTFRDQYATLQGDNSIVGRSIVVHDGADNSIRVMYGVIGILEEGAPTEAADGATPEETPKVLVARAVVYPTSATVDSDRSQVLGTVEFSAEDGSSENTLVTYQFTGLTRDEGGHGWHVHEWGDISSADATATGAHFRGTCNDTTPPCREGEGVAAEIGNIDDGAPLVPLFGESYGSFVDANLPLNGPDSIVGRSVVVHGLGTDGAIRVGQGVIGRVVDSAAEMVPNQGEINALRCDITPLENDDGYNAEGYVRMTRPASDGNITVEYRITNLSPGEHAWHVHNWGNLLGNQDAVVTTGDHFVGNPLPDRPEGANEVGAINNETPITANAEGIAEGSFVDNFLAFDGAHSIVGRSIIVHATPTGGPREAVCVLGIDLPDEIEDVDSEEEGPDAASTATFSLAMIIVSSALALFAY